MYISSRGGDYHSGFHVFTNVADAIEWGSDEPEWDTVIVKVEGRGRICLGTQRCMDRKSKEIMLNTMVCKEMKIVQELINANHFH